MSRKGVYTAVSTDKTIHKHVTLRISEREQKSPDPIQVHLHVINWEDHEVEYTFITYPKTSRQEDLIES